MNAYCELLMKGELQRVSRYLVLDVAGSTIGSLLMLLAGLHPAFPIGLLVSSVATVYIVRRSLARRMDSLCTALCVECTEALAHPGRDSYTCSMDSRLVCYSPSQARLYIYEKPRGAALVSGGDFSCVRFEGGEFIRVEGYEIYEGKASVLSAGRPGEALFGATRIIIVDISGPGGLRVARELLSCMGQ